MPVNLWLPLEDAWELRYHSSNSFHGDYFGFKIIGEQKPCTTSTTSTTTTATTTTTTVAPTSPAVSSTTADDVIIVDNCSLSGTCEEEEEEEEGGGRTAPLEVETTTETENIPTPSRRMAG